jgi:hypothetical protein
MCDDVNGARMSWVEDERRALILGATVLAVLPRPNAYIA